MAIDADGVCVYYNSPDACNWCLEGALYLAVTGCDNKVDKSLAYTSCYRRIVDVVVDIYPKQYIASPGTLAEFNDNIGTTKELVVDIIEKTIDAELNREGKLDTPIYNADSLGMFKFDNNTKP